MTRSELKKLVQDTVVYDAWKKLSKIGGDIEVSIDRDGVPHLSIDTGDDNCRVRIATRATEDDYGEPGWEFIPTVINASIREPISFENQGEVGARFKRWALIAEVAEKIFEIEFFPGYYEED